jgi:aryl-alcohol dehydrogenase-like predicted oxidoreductase
MQTAWDAGITLYDTARSYGYGQAEAVLGEFLRGKRDQAVVATKFGIHPQQLSQLKRIAIPAARAAMKAIPPSLKRRLKGEIPADQAAGNFTIQGLRESLESSLHALKTDYVDILFLHEASAQSMRHDELMRELEALVQAGKMLRTGLYASPGVVAEAALKGPEILSVMQFGADPFNPAVAAIANSNRKDLFLIGNHPFGSEQRVARLNTALAAIAANESTPHLLRDKLKETGSQSLLDVLLGVALEGMGNHALVFSMMQPEHLKANVRAMDSNRFSAEELKWLYDLITSPAAP